MADTDLVASLARKVEDLAHRWERYIARDPQEPLPPDRDRADLERQLRVLSRQEGRSTSESFRFEQLLHRFSTLSALWQRQLREREEALVGGHYVRGHEQSHPNATTPASVSAEERYDALFARYTAALQRNGRQVGVTPERFRTTLEAQRRELEGRGANVEGFDVAEENGQVKVRARIRRGRQE